MEANKISDFLDELAPKSLAYDGEEFGFIYGANPNDIKKIAVTWRPTIDVLKKAAENKIDLLITHEPLFHSEKAAIIPKEELSFTPNRVRKDILDEHNILVYRYHSQWDEAEEGNNNTLVKLFDLKNITKIPFGRIGEIKPTNLGNFIEIIKEKLGCNKVITTDANMDTEIKNVGFISGSGNSLIEMIEYMKTKGADVLVSGDIADGRARYAREINLPVIDVGGYYSEKPGMINLSEILKNKYPELEVMFLDTEKPWDIM